MIEAVAFEMAILISSMVPAVRNGAEVRPKQEVSEILWGHDYLFS